MVSQAISAVSNTNNVIMKELLTVRHKYVTFCILMWQLVCERTISVSASSAEVLIQKLCLWCKHDTVQFVQDPGHLHKYSTTQCLCTLLHRVRSTLKWLIWFYALLLCRIPWWWSLADRIV